MLFKYMAWCVRLATAIMKFVFQMCITSSVFHPTISNIYVGWNSLKFTAFALCFLLHNRFTIIENLVCNRVAFIVVEFY